MTPEELLANWHTQQTAFIEFRDMRTRAMIDVLKELRATLKRELYILDLGCGPGSLGQAIINQLPGSTVVGLDRDPILLRLAQETSNDPEHMVFLDVDLTTRQWVVDLPHERYDAVVSATALHWLDPEDLTSLYLSMATVMNPGGIFMNADHLYFDSHTQPFLHQFSESYRNQFQEQTNNRGVLTWDQWWELALAMPGWEAEAEEWHRRWANKSATVKVSAQFHYAALRAAGFCEIDQIYQWFDDRVIYARLPIE